MDLQGVSLAKLKYLSQNSLTCLFLIRLNQNTWEIWRVKGNSSHFVIHIFSFICIFNCSTFPGTSFSFSVSGVFVFNPMTKGHGFCWTPTLSRSEATPAHMGFSLSSLGSGSYLWVPVCFSSPTLHYPSFCLSALCI